MSKSLLSISRQGRESCLRVETAQGYRACNLTYRSHEIYGGKPGLEGLPATHGGEEDCATLRYVEPGVSNRKTRSCSLKKIFIASPLTRRNRRLFSPLMIVGFPDSVNHYLANFFTPAQKKTGIR